MIERNRKRINGSVVSRLAVVFTFTNEGPEQPEETHPVMS